MAEDTPSDHDLHRQFGVRLNNGTWDTLDDGSVTAESDERTRESFLYGAYACVYHWLQVGNEANHARGEHLISRAATQIGKPELGIHHAQRCLEICKANPGVVEDWDFAFAYEALARSTAAAGDLGTAATYLAEAKARGATIEDKDDREVFLEVMGAQPWFGLQ